MKCPKCGYENKPDAEICGLCRSVKFVKSTTQAVKGAAAQAAARQTPAPRSAPPKPKHLLVRVGAPPLELVPGQPFTFGRQPNCSLTIPSNRVSRVHAEITWNGEKPVISDKGSANGTFVGGKRVKEQELAPGDEIEVGPFLCVYQYGEQGKKKPDELPPGEMQTITEQGELLAGVITGAGLAEVFQGLEFNTKTGTLAVFTRQGDGWVTVQNGVPLAAEAFDKKDEEAVIELLMLKHGRFTFTDDMKERTKRIKPTITGLLLEWGRRADEQGAPDPEATNDPDATIKFKPGDETKDDE